MSGFDKLRQELKKRQGKPEIVVVVGYSQSYAFEVHERTDIPHKPGKQAKYLEGPARSSEAEIRAMIDAAPDLATGLLRAGLLLQRLSQEVVPIDTGALKASAYTAFQEEAEAAAMTAKSRADALRNPQEMVE